MPDRMDVPSWSDFQAARQRFLDGLAADTALRRLGEGGGGRAAGLAGAVRVPGAPPTPPRAASGGRAR